MIPLRLPRNHVRDIKTYFFPYIREAKLTRLKEVAHHSINSYEYLAATMINCLLTEIEDLFIKKLVNTTGNIIKFQFTDAQAVVFYQALIHYPLHKDNFYLQKIRNEWIQFLDQQLIREQVLQQNGYKPDAATHWSDHYDA